MQQPNEILASLKALKEVHRKEMREKTRSSLIELMRATNTPTILFCGYTEGRPHFTNYFGPPGGQSFLTLYTIEGDDEVVLRKYRSTKQMPPEDSKGDWPSCNSSLGDMFFEHLVEGYGACESTNSKGVIRLLEDGTLQVKLQPYHPDWE